MARITENSLLLSGYTLVTLCSIKYGSMNKFLVSPDRTMFTNAYFDGGLHLQKIDLKYSSHKEIISALEV